MFGLFNETYWELASFVPINDIQKTYFKNKYISFINLDYIKFVLDKDNKLIAFGDVMPSFSIAMQKNKVKTLYFIILAYQIKGVTVVLFNQYNKTFSELGIQNCIRTPELEDNLAIKQIWKFFKPEVYKKKMYYKKSF